MTTSSPSAQISVFAGQRFACLKVQGRATFTVSVDFKSALLQLHERGVRFFVIELSRCAIMDSTFLGELAGFGVKLNQGEAARATGCVELRNANARIVELLESLGVVHLFKLAEGELETPEVLEAVAVECAQASRYEVTKACWQAHVTLGEINPANVARFEDVTKFLAEEINRMKPPAAS